MSCGYECEYSCEECDVPDKVIEFVNGYNQALDDALNVVEWDGYTLDIKKKIEQLKR